MLKQILEKLVDEHGVILVRDTLDMITANWDDEPGNHVDGAIVNNGRTITKLNRVKMVYELGIKHSLTEALHWVEHNYPNKGSTK